MKKQLHVLFSGTVQGVGFRYTAQRLARRFSVTGFVKNLPNGQVELAAEGEEKDLQGFLGAVQGEFNSFIRDADIQWKEPAGSYQSFSIAF